MALLHHDLDLALTQLTERLLTQDQTQATTYVMAKGQFYRAELRLVPVSPDDLPTDI
ncbi:MULTISPECIES: hypothetical protein [unclassified Halomonas]|uniref:hypothetical protein n=1 Tax=unclassified Halomonas TaxID=2609666 RepID=UPI001EF69EA1|nr:MULTISPECIES: hypothetical protein [unclassified Halomonas]MCG7591506.1 hypothetical protein [Halomonas sp. McD50-5]MCG7617618.1 hypothetical protein [Halomonas sp. McD50-4]